MPDHRLGRKLDWDLARSGREGHDLPFAAALMPSLASVRLALAEAVPSARTRLPLAAHVEVAPGVLAEAVDAEAARELQRGVFGRREIRGGLIDHPRDLRA